MDFRGGEGAFMLDSRLCEQVNNTKISRAELDISEKTIK